MQVKCKSKEGFLLSRNSVKAGSDQMTLYDSLTVEKVYEVFGIVHFKESIYYLIMDDNEMPTWYSCELFIISESEITRKWYYRFMGYNDNGITFLCGYQSIVESEKHYNGLIERNDSDFVLFKTSNNYSQKDK